MAGIGPRTLAEGDHASFYSDVRLIGRGASGDASLATTNAAAARIGLASGRQVVIKRTQLRGDRERHMQEISVLAAVSGGAALVWRGHPPLSPCCAA
jgi:hypothetical protein